MVGVRSFLTLLKTGTPVATNNTGLLFLLIEADRVSALANKLRWESCEEEVICSVNMRPWRLRNHTKGSHIPKSRSGAATEPKQLLHRSQLVRISRHDLISHSV